MNSNRKGFTLIELLIVIGLSGFIYMTLFTLHFQVKKLAADQVRNSGQSTAIMDLAAVFSADLANLVFEKHNTRQVFFTDKEVHGGKRFDAFVFPSGSLYSNPYVFQARSFMVSYCVEPDARSGDYILYRAEDLFIDAKNLFQGIPVPMVSLVDEFRVLGSNNGIDYEEGWDFRIRRMIPRYVRMIIRYRENKDSYEVKEYSVDVRPPILWN